MLRTICIGLMTAVLAGPALAADPYSIKATEKAAAPKELNEAVRAMLPEKSVKFLDDKGELVAELWFRKQVPAKATENQIKNGLTYQEIPQTTLLGAVEVHKQMGDYRKQKIKPGVYTMRLAYQPMDGDHMGTAFFNEFVLLLPAAIDKGTATLKPEELHEKSMKASGTGHPAVWQLMPVPKKELENTPKLAKKFTDHWVLSVSVEVVVGDKKTVMGIGLTLVGVSMAA